MKVLLWLSPFLFLITQYKNKIKYQVILIGIQQLSREREDHTLRPQRHVEKLSLKSSRLLLELQEASELHLPSGHRACREPVHQPESLYLLHP